MNRRDLFPEMFRGRREPGTDGPPTLRLQPEPRSAHVAHLNGTTAIARVWHPGDTRRCGLCPECAADHDDAVCLVIVAGLVPDHGALMYDAREATWVPLRRKPNG